MSAMDTSPTPMFWKNARIMIIPHLMMKQRLIGFEKQIIRFGGTCTTDMSNATHVIVNFDLLDHNKKISKNRSLEEVLKIIKVDLHEYDNANYEVLSSLWLSNCIKEKKMVAIEPYKFNREAQEETVSSPHLEETAELSDQSLIPVILEIMAHSSTLPAFGAKNRPTTEGKWDTKDDAWLQRMWNLRKGFFQTGVVPKLEDV